MEPEKQTTSPDPTKQCAVTNGSSASVVVLTPSVAAAPGNTGTVSVYDQSLAVLPIAEGGTVIAVGKTGTVTLDQYYTDPTTKQPTYSLVYDLLVSTADWYYPVANIGVMQNIFGTPVSFPAQKAKQADQQSMKDADVFYQTIAAYPTSQLTKNYQAAMTGALSAGSAAANGTPDSSTNVANAVGSGADAFFKTTKQFQDVTLANLVAVQSYYDKFPFGWAQYQTTTYYLYGSVSNATNFIGTLTLTKPATLDLTKPNGGYVCTFTPASNPTDTTTVDVDAQQAKTLTYSNGLFVDDVNVDIPQVALKGTYQLKRLFTQTTTDTQAIVVITGTVDSVVCIGFDQPQRSNDPGSSSFWTTLFEPKGAAQIFSSIMQIGGFLMLLHFAGSTAYGIYKWAKTRGEPTLADQLKDQQANFEKAMKEQIDTAVQKLSNGKNQAPDNPSDAMSDLAAQRQVVSDNVSANNLQSGLDSQANSLEQIAEFEAQMNAAQVQSLEKNATDVKNANDALTDASPQDLGSVVTTQQQNLGDIQSNVSDLTTSMDDVLSANAKASIEANAQASQTVTEDVQQAKDDAKTDESDSDPEVEDPTIPEVG